MGLFNRKKATAAEKEVESARFQVDMAVLRMTKVLDKVQEQASKAKEELHGRRAS